MPNADVYALKREALAEFEALSEQGHIDLLYGDESRVSLLPCVPYGWQFADEQAAMPTQRGGGVNCFALLSRRNECRPHFTEGKVTAAWIGERLDALSLSVRRPTVIVLDNASVHRKAVRERGHIQRARPHSESAATFRERGHIWQGRGLSVFYLPTYSPHLNIAEVLWRKLKYEWLRPEDYADEETLRLAVWQAPAAVGQSLKIQLSAFKMV